MRVWPLSAALTAAFHRENCPTESAQAVNVAMASALPYDFAALREVNAALSKRAACVVERAPPPRAKSAPEALAAADAPAELYDHQADTSPWDPDVAEYVNVVASAEHSATVAQLKKVLRSAVFGGQRREGNSEAERALSE